MTPIRSYLTSILEDFAFHAKWAVKWLTGRETLPSIDNLERDYSLYRRRFFKFEYEWIHRDEVLKNDLSVCHNAIDETYRSIKSMLFNTRLYRSTSSEYKYTPTPIPPENKNQLYFNFKDAVKSISENTLDDRREKELKDFLNQYSVLNFRLFDCENYSIRYIKELIYLYKLLPDLVARYQDIRVLLPESKNVPSNLTVVDLLTTFNDGSRFFKVYNLIFIIIPGIITGFESDNLENELPQLVEKVDWSLRKTNLAQFDAKLLEKLQLIFDAGEEYEVVSEWFKQVFH